MYTRLLAPASHIKAPAPVGGPPGQSVAAAFIRMKAEQQPAPASTDDSYLSCHHRPMKLALSILK